MWYIIENDGDHIERELGSTDIFDYEGETIFCDDEDTLIDGVIECYTINDTFLTEYDWFEDMDDYDKIDAYRKGTYGKWQHAIENWEDDYVGQYNSDEEFAQSLYEDRPAHPLMNYIDWEAVARDEMHSYFEEDGYYFMV